MRSVRIFILMPVLLLMGCIHSRVVDEASYQLLNDKLANKEATVRFSDGRKLAARDIQVGFDSTSWKVVDQDSLYIQQTATSQIVSIQVVKQWKGAVEGAGIGLLTGAVLGGVIGFLDGDDKASDSFFDTAGEKALMAGAAFSVLGVPIGTFAGGSMGSKDRYVLKPSKTPVRQLAAVRLRAVRRE